MTKQEEAKQEAKQQALSRFTANPDTPFSVKQLMTISQATPKQHIKFRKGRGGKDVAFVSGSFIKKTLNDVFGWCWSFEVKEHGKSPSGDSIWTLGRLTVLNPQTFQPMLVKEQFGRADIKFMKGTKKEVDFGNDLKAATTDALKKCAAELGICSDVYADEETRLEIESEVEQTFNTVKQMAAQKERDWVIELIEGAKTLEELKKCEKALKNMDEEVNEMYRMKLELLTKEK